MIGEKTIEYYENRDDRVIYRSVRLIILIYYYHLIIIIKKIF